MRFADQHDEPPRHPVAELDPHLEYRQATQTWNLIPRGVAARSPVLQLLADRRLYLVVELGKPLDVVLTVGCEPCRTLAAYAPSNERATYSLNRSLEASSHVSCRSSNSERTSESCRKTIE